MTSVWPADKASGLVSYEATCEEGGGGGGLMLDRCVRSTAQDESVQPAATGQQQRPGGAAHSAHPGHSTVIASRRIPLSQQSRV